VGIIGRGFAGLGVAVVIVFIISLCYADDRSVAIDIASYVIGGGLGFVIGVASGSDPDDHRTSRDEY
jgi:hypothetical protein